MGEITENVCYLFSCISHSSKMWSHDYRAVELFVIVVTTRTMAVSESPWSIGGFSWNESWEYHYLQYKENYFIFLKP